MLKTFNRNRRLSQEIQKAIAFILQRNIKDPRINMMSTVSNVLMSRDLAYAKVFMTFLNEKDKKAISDNIKALQNASGFIRFLLRKKMYIRIVPKLTFIYDTSFLKEEKIFTCLSKLVKYDKEVYLPQIR